MANRSKVVSTLRHKSRVFTRERISHLQNSGTVALEDFTSLVFLICDSHRFPDMYDLLKNLKKSNFSTQLDFFEIFNQFTDWEHKFIEALERLNNKKALLSFNMLLSDWSVRDHKYYLNASRVILYRILEELNAEDGRSLVEHMKLINAPIPNEDLYFLELYFMYWHFNGFLNVDDQKGFDLVAMSLHNIGKPELACTLGWHPELHYNRFTFDDTFPIEIYPIRNVESTGLCLIINQVRYGGKAIDRESSLVDVDKLKRLMSSLNFTVISMEDVDAFNFCDIIKRIVSDFFSQKHSIFMLVVMAHGHLGTVLCPFSNTSETMRYFTRPVSQPVYGEVEVKEIRDCIFECDVLRGKPKIFILNACRGGSMFTTQPCYRVEMASIEAEPEVLTQSDIITCYSALPDFISFRDKYKGSLFINVFCDVLYKRPDIEVCELFTLVNARLMRPTPELSRSFEKGGIGERKKLANPLEFTSSLTKKLYLKVPDTFCNLNV